MANVTQTDEHAIRHVIDSAYRSLAFDPGDEPDWQAFTAPFDDRAVLALRVFPHDAQIRILDLAEYAKAQMGNGLQEQGYSEEPGQGTIEVFGDVALVRQFFTMVFVDRRVSAIDIFSLARVDGAWRIVAVVSDLA